MFVTLEELADQPEYQWSYKFRFSVRDGEIPGTGIGGGDDAKTAIKVLSTTTPSKSFPEALVVVGGHEQSLDGYAQYNRELPLTLIENQQGFVLNGFERWQDLMQDPVTGERSPISEYARTVNLDLLNNNDIAVQRYTLFFARPTSINNVPLAGDTNDLVRPEITLRFTYYTHELLNV